MYAYNVSRDDLLAAARTVNLAISADNEPDRKRVRFSLSLADLSDNRRKLSPNPLANGGCQWRKGSSRKGGGAACFHAHWQFFVALFAQNPDAIVTSSRIGNVRYTADNFEDTANELGDLALNSYPDSPYNSFRNRDCCNCESHKRDL